MKLRSAPIPRRGLRRRTALHFRRLPFCVAVIPRPRQHARQRSRCRWRVRHHKNHRRTGRRHHSILRLRLRLVHRGAAIRLSLGRRLRDPHRRSRNRRRNLQRQNLLRCIARSRRNHGARLSQVAFRFRARLFSRSIRNSTRNPRNRRGLRLRGSSRQQIEKRGNAIPRLRRRSSHRLQVRRSRSGNAHAKKCARGTPQIRHTRVLRSRPSQH